MPLTYNQIIGTIRELLIEPLPTRPNEPYVFQHLKLNAQLLFNQAINAPPNWALDSVRLDVDDTTDIFTVNAQNFAKDVLVVTVDDTDPNHVERPIRRMSVQSAPLGGNDAYAYTGNFTQRGQQHSAQTMIFWREPLGTIKVKVMPRPDQVATYKIWFEVAEPNTDSLGNTFTIPQAISLLTVKTAFDCLPGTDWCGYTKAENQDKRKELALTLGQAVKDHGMEYRRFIANDRKPGRVLANGFQDRNYSGRGAW